LVNYFLFDVCGICALSTSLIGEYGDQQVSVFIYGINIVIAGFWMNMQWGYAAKDHHL
jgi:hypothetical protein